MTELVIVVPGRPPNPNARLHWAALARARADWRGWTKLAALERRNATPGSYPLRRAVIEPTFLVRSRRRRDPDNLYASLKPLIDGLVDAGIVADDDVFSVQLRGPRVELAKVDAVRLRIHEGTWREE